MHALLALRKPTTQPFSCAVCKPNLLPVPSMLCIVLVSVVTLRTKHRHWMPASPSVAKFGHSVSVDPIFLSAKLGFAVNPHSISRYPQC